MQEISFIPFRDLMLWIVWNANIFVEKNKMKTFYFFSYVLDIQGMIFNIDIYQYCTEKPNFYNVVSKKSYHKYFCI